jgi:hypothetical protein
MLPRMQGEGFEIEEFRFGHGVIRSRSCFENLVCGGLQAALLVDLRANPHNFFLKLADIIVEGVYRQAVQLAR